VCQLREHRLQPPHQLAAGALQQRRQLLEGRVQAAVHQARMGGGVVRQAQQAIPVQMRVCRRQGRGLSNQCVG
jgi:hypothetical protein